MRTRSRSQGRFCGARRGPQLQAAMFERDEHPDPAAIEDAAGRLRALLAAERG